MARKSAAERKADIVAALLLLADRIGPDRLTTTDIAREVGVTQAAVFRHFPTKAALWTSAAEGIAALLESGWQAAIAANPRPRDRLRALLAVHLSLNETCPAMPAILNSRELAADDAALRARFCGTRRSCCWTSRHRRWTRPRRRRFRKRSNPCPRGARRW